MGQSTTTDHLNSAEFVCSEENESCSGGYPELIHSVGGDRLGGRPTAVITKKSNIKMKISTANMEILENQSLSSFAARIGSELAIIHL